MSAVDDLLRRWAARKYGLTGVTRVCFRDEEGYGGSEWTPADPNHVSIVVYHDGGVRHDMRLYEAGLIREVLGEVVDGEVR